VSLLRVRERHLRLGRARSSTSGEVQEGIGAVQGELEGCIAAAHGEVEEGIAADRIAAVLLAVLRTGTLVLGATEIRSATGLTHPAAARTTLLALAAQSAAVFALVAWRLRRRVPRAMGDGVAIVETLAGVGGLLVLAHATPPSLRTSSTFWIEPYTVISALMLAASARRAILGALGAACLTATYLAAVFVVAPGGASLSSVARATAVTNAISYLPFFAIGAIGFAVLRSVVGQTDQLRRLLSRLSEERARVTAAKDAYRVGHDIPKALLREVHREWLSVTTLRSLAGKYRERLLSKLSDDTPPAADLREEIAAVADVFAVASALSIDLEQLGEVPTGAPTVLIAEAVRELLNNASYHAHGAAITLTGRSSTELVWIAVHDDGPGVEPATLAATWALKQNTLHLLAAAGGAYEICSGGSLASSTVAGGDREIHSGEPAAGTIVTVTWPAAAIAARGGNAPCGAAGDAPGSKDVEHDLL
jgi:signal transduction histidine kinase